jgi:hypothetical protein
MQDAITLAIVNAVLMLCALCVTFWFSVAVLGFISKHMLSLAVLSAVAAGIAWVVKAEPFGPINPDYYVLVPLGTLVTLGALATCYGWLMKLEKLWDRAIEARRYRKLQSNLPWGPRPPQT